MPKRVVLAYDCDGWAWHHMAVGLQKAAPPGYDVEIATAAAVRNRSGYDAVLWMSWPEAPLHRELAPRICTLVASHGLEYGKDDRQEEVIPTHIITGLRNRERAEKKLPQFDAVLCVSRALHTIASSIPGVTAIHTLPGVDADLFYPTQPIGRGPKIRVGWSGQAKGVTKGYAEIVEPLVDYLRERDLHRHIEIQVNTRDSGNPLSPAEMRDFYNSCDLFLSTSCSEGCQMPVMEAMACGRPVIATSAGAVPEVVFSDTYGKILPAWSTAAEARDLVPVIAGTIISYAVNREVLQTTGEACRRRMLGQFSWHWVAPLWLQAICGEPLEGRR